MRETITVQVGQAGNQIGNQIWRLLLQEHEKTSDTDDALSAFFRFAPQRDGRTMVMKARALLIDMECGPLQETMRSPLGSLFDDTQFVMDVYGSGNNFAHGHYVYGPQYRSMFEEGLRRNAEHCDSLQTFIVTHSLGGGTGSGVGSYVMGLLDDLYPDIYRFSACVFPSEDNDVVTSPYNSVLATRELIEHADCVLPIDNHALQAFAQLEASQAAKKRGGASTIAPSSSSTPDSTRKSKSTDRGFDDMNLIAARMLCHLTSSSRFHGDMNVDMNEICTNLVPYPRLHFLMTALSPQRAHSGSGIGSTFGSAGKGGASTCSSGSLTGRGAVQRAFADILAHTGQITAADPCSPGCITLASAFLARGPLSFSDFLSCVTAAQQKSLQFPSWNQNACKIGMCGTAGPGEGGSVLAVYNSTAFGSVLSRERTRFNLLFRRRAMLHHYTEFVGVDAISEAESVCSSVIAEYEDIEAAAAQGHVRAPRQDTRGSSHGNGAPVELFPAF